MGRDAPNVAVGGVLPAAFRLNPGHEGWQVDRRRPGEPVDVRMPIVALLSSRLGGLASRVWGG